MKPADLVKFEKIMQDVADGMTELVKNFKASKSQDMDTDWWQYAEDLDAHGANCTMLAKQLKKIYK